MKSSNRSLEISVKRFGALVVVALSSVSCDMMIGSSDYANCEYARVWSAYRVTGDADVIGVSGSQAATRPGRIFDTHTDTIAFQASGGLRGLGGSWAVGDSGTIAEGYPPTRLWALSMSPVTQDLNAIWYPWIVGAEGTVLRFDGTDWLAEPAIGPETLRGVWATDTSVWAVGDGVIYRRANETWGREPGGDGGMWRAVSGQDDNNVWVVGASGAILYWDGETWVSVASGVTVDLNAVWTSPNNAFVWAAGNEGTILRVGVASGHEVVALDAPVDDDLFCIWNHPMSPEFPPDFPDGYCGSRGLVLIDKGVQLVSGCESR